MTVQVDSQPVTDQNRWCIDMCCINNSISCLEKKTTFGTHKLTMSTSMLVCPFLVSLKFTRPELMGRSFVTLVLLNVITEFVSFTCQCQQGATNQPFCIWRRRTYKTVLFLCLRQLESLKRMLNTTKPCVSSYYNALIYIDPSLNSFLNGFINSYIFSARV